MDEFATEDVLQQAKGNAQAITSVTVAYLKSKGLPTDDYWSFVGEKFALGWEQLQGKGALAAMRNFALNMVSIGATLDALSGDEGRAEAVLSDWPSPDMLYGVDRGAVDGSLAVFDAIAHLLSLKYEWHRSGEQLTLVLSQ